MTDAPVWWARDRADRLVFEARVDSLVGTSLAHVRYFDFDTSEGVRAVPEGEEWLDPPWRRDEFDLLNWGLELDTSDGRTFATTWYTSPFEGIDFEEERFLRTSLGSDAWVAIWDVTATERWSDYIGRTVTRVQVCWERWERRAFACHAVVLDVGGAMVVIGGEGDFVVVTFGARLEKVALLRGSFLVEERERDGVSNPVGDHPLRILLGQETFPHAREREDFPLAPPQGSRGRASGQCV